MSMTYQEIADEMTRRGYPMGQSTAQFILKRALQRIREQLEEELPCERRVVRHRRNGKRVKL